MQSSSPYSNLRFADVRRYIPYRLIAVGVVALGIAIAWLLLPVGGLFCLTLPAGLLLTWLASYGWRPAIAALIALLHRLQGI